MFKEIPANEMSFAKRKPVYGVGYNDANYITSIKIDGKITRCPFYKKWHSMLERCYDDIFHLKHPTYKDCTVTKEWLSFNNFKQWMKLQDWEGKELDKDIVSIGNKIYSENTCVFVSRYVNGILVDNAGKRGKYPQGVYLSSDKRIKKFTARCLINKKKKFLGRFKTEEEAYNVYKIAKSNEIRRVADLQKNKLVRDGLYRHADYLIDEYEEPIE